VLELKKGCVAESDTVKQRGYFQHMQATGLNCAYFLLTTDKSDVKVNEFTVMSYHDLCRKLRVWAAERCKSENRSNLTLVAMVLAFVGAVEANLLDFIISDGLPSDQILDYLKWWQRGQ
jgi:hypothetical protein